MQDIPDIVTSIREAAALTGLTEDTIRYYEKVGLLPYAERKTNGHRQYSKDHILGIIFLTRLKATGMTIEQMKYYRELSEQGPETLSARYAILEEHQRKIQQEISRLNETSEIIAYKLQHYREISEHPDLDDPHCNPTF
ncbi:MerR family transcriptional regulator [Paenibacillus pabuli]|uniref:MerR family transcriptional regulator n=1 Tax=Paenibacillus pabuli TaxID=1472 RepID=UPI00078354D9|nr:MerR family transcriptional regulator [Paenibacillus pabuli]MEC0125614.1 MerR family transcriptional regulator [Paenibacillus pabuli]